MKGNMENPLHLTSLNHISLVSASLDEAFKFYQYVLGFVPIRRPCSFDFNGAWLFGHGIGIHLLQSEDPASLPKKTKINLKDNHISFQCESMVAVEKKLKEMEIKYERALVEEGGIYVEQLFFHDPDGFMIEICNCDNLPVVPLVDHARDWTCNSWRRSSFSNWFNSEKHKLIRICSSLDRMS